MEQWRNFLGYEYKPAISRILTSVRRTDDIFVEYLDKQIHDYFVPRMWILVYEDQAPEA